MEQDVLDELEKFRIFESGKFIPNTEILYIDVGYEGVLFEIFIDTPARYKRSKDGVNNYNGRLFYKRFWYSGYPKYVDFDGFVVNDTDIIFYYGTYVVAKIERFLLEYPTNARKPYQITIRIGDFVYEDGSSLNYPMMSYSACKGVFRRNKDVYESMLRGDISAKTNILRLLMKEHGGTADPKLIIDYLEKLIECANIYNPYTI